MGKIKFRYIIVAAILLYLMVFVYQNYLRPVESNKFDKKNIHYVNSLYLSSGLHYNSLNEQEKALYLEIVDQYMKFDNKIVLNLKEYGCKGLSSCNIESNKVLDAVMLDHPELLQLSGWGLSYDHTTSMMTIELESSINSKLSYELALMRVQRKIDTIKKETQNMSEKDKVIYVYEWIGSHAKYDRLFTYLSKNQSAYSALIKRSGVCSAFAKASQLIFQNIGIESHLVTGDSTGPHMWNMVKIDGKYYFYDSTVASSLGRESTSYYQGLSQAYVGSFSVKYKETYPKTSTEDFF